MKIGDYDTFPHYEVIGTATNFYVWIQLERGKWAWYESGKKGASDWITGREAFEKYNKLKEFFNKKQFDKFISLATHLHRTHKGKTQYDRKD